MCNCFKSFVISIWSFMYWPIGFIVFYTVQKWIPSKTPIILDSSNNLFSSSKLISSKVYPIVYNENYNISLFGLEKVHYFDTKKWRKIYMNLLKDFEDNKEIFESISPLRYISNEELEIVHTKKFVQDMNTSKRMIANAAESYLVYCLPNCILQYNLIQPFKWQTSGSILASYYAMKHGWAINLGGGFHHASSTIAEGFCFFADITLIIKYLWKYYKDDIKFMIVDLDAHQGNGYERDKFTFFPDDKDKVFIFDMYNRDIYPQDDIIKPMINMKCEISSTITGAAYLDFLEVYFEECLKTFTPDLIIYNAGTDILDGDPLGHLKINSEEIKMRDEYIFTKAKSHNISIVMLTSGGYLKSNSRIISESILNMIHKKIIAPINLLPDEQDVKEPIVGETSPLLKLR